MTASLEGAVAVLLAVLSIHDPELRHGDRSSSRVVLEVHQKFRQRGVIPPVPLDLARRVGASALARSEDARRRPPMPVYASLCGRLSLANRHEWGMRPFPGRVVVSGSGSEEMSSKG